MSKEELKEMKATGENSENNDPVVPAGGSPKGKNRKADLNKSVDPKVDEIEDDVKTPKGTNDVGLKEAFDSLFEGSDLSEDFKEKTLTIFEAAVHERLAEEVASLEEKFSTELDEQVNTIVKDLSEKVDSYLEYVVKEWVENNNLAIESAFKVEMAESLLSGITNLLAEHRINLSEEDSDALSQMESRLERMEEKYNRLADNFIEITEEKEALEREIALAEISEGLTDTQADRLQTLAEGVSYSDIDEYKEKLSTIRENYFKTPTRTISNESEYLEEETESEDKPVSTDPSIARYADAIGRMSK